MTNSNHELHVTMIRLTEAQRLCGQIRGQGGYCFVRAAAGDASIRWAARYADPRQRAV